MSVYFLAHIDLTDEGEYRKYLDRVNEVFRRFKGTYLAVDEQPQVIEGEPAEGRIVLIRFDSRKDFEDWYYSDAYQEILKHRLKGSVSKSWLVEGLADEGI